MKKEYSVRRAIPSEAAVIRDFQIAMARETESIDLVHETVDRGVRAVFENLEKGEYWVAVDRLNKVIGSLFLVPEWSDWRNRTVLWIHSVYIAPDVRRQGVFKEMYRILRSHVSERPELSGLRLYVDKRNESAKRVYQALGMSNEHYDLFEWMK